MRHATQRFFQAVLLGLGLMAWPALQAQTVVKYVHTDALGSVVAMTDSTGAVVDGRREYEAYGQQLTPAVRDGPGYTGHVQDAATGLVYMQQRYYDSGIGMFLSVDPVTAYEQPVTNFCRYCYARNNPYLFTDPDGRQSKARNKQTGRMLRALWDSKGDPGKYREIMDQHKANDRVVFDTIVDMTAVAPVKDAVEVSIKVAGGEDAVGQGTGSIVGEVADQVTQKVLDGKIGNDAAQAAGALVGKAVGDTVEAGINSVRAGGSGQGAPDGESKPINPPEPINLRDKR